MFQTIWQIYLSLLIISAVGSFALIANVMLDRWLELHRQKPLELPEFDPPGEPMPESSETADKPEPASTPVIKVATLPETESQPEKEVVEEPNEVAGNSEAPPPIPQQQEIIPSANEETEPH